MMSEGASTAPTLTNAVDRLVKLAGRIDELVEQAHNLGLALQVQPQPPANPPNSPGLVAKDSPMPSAVVSALHHLLYDVEQKAARLDDALHHIQIAIGHR